ncbi:hypothetical protein ACF0H5_001677 [Mactra antiquata]
MGSGNSQLNPVEIGIDNRFSESTSDKVEQSVENNPELATLVSEKTKPRIILSINNDNTIRIAAGKSISTQTVDDTEKENEDVMDEVAENGSPPIETKHHQEIQTDFDKPSKIDNNSVTGEIAKDKEENEENKETDIPLEVETDNEAGYVTDLGVQTDDCDDAWGEQSIDSALTLQENSKEAHNEEEKESDTQAEDNNDDDLEEYMEARPFGEVTLEKYGKYKIRMSSDKKNCIASSAAFLETGDAVIIDRSNQSIKFVDKKFQYISAHELPAKPWAVCTQGIDVYVTIGNTQIQHLTVEDMIIEPAEVFEVKGRCLGICTVDTYLAVGLQIGEISLLDFKGVYKESIALPKINGKPCNPWHLSSTKENNILVTDSDTGCVYCVNKKSELIFQFKGIDTPRATVLDNEGNIVVVGRDKVSNAVVVLLHRDVELQNILHIDEGSKKEQDSKILIKWDELEFVPYSVCYRKDRIIVLGGIQETLKIMRLW